MNTRILILAGLGGSGPAHWQSLWAEADPACLRVQQRDWDHPVLEEWLAVLNDSVSCAGPNVVFVAHSLACLLVAHWAAQSAVPVRGALLVAPPDPGGPNFPAAAAGFAPFPQQALPFPSTVVASSDDRYASLAFAESCAAAWGSEFVSIGAAGHINAASGFGAWPEGYALLQQRISRPV
jgi:predicted alpha/beta hydrolase family esterase